MALTAITKQEIPKIPNCIVVHYMGLTRFPRHPKPEKLICIETSVEMAIWRRSTSIKMLWKNFEESRKCT